MTTKENKTELHHESSKLLASESNPSENPHALYAHVLYFLITLLL